MIDFGDIDGVYHDPQMTVEEKQTVAKENTTALKNYIAERAKKALALQFTGPQNSARGNKREPGIAYFDLSGGEKGNDGIRFDLSINGITDLRLSGGGSLIGLNAQHATTPFFSLERDIRIDPFVSIENLRIRNEKGSGILLHRAGTLFNLSNLSIHAGGGDESTMTADDMGDLLTASYGIKILDSDGTRLEACQIKDCENHGIIADRWHAGATSQVQIHNSKGSGLKGQFINGTNLHIRCESNRFWGVHVRNCGSIKHGDVTSTGKKHAGEAGAWELWCENNNFRDQTVHSQGHPFRQTRFESGCARLKILGRSGWSANMVDVSKAVRVANQFISGGWTEPSILPVQDMKEMVSADIPDFSVSNPVHNWDTKWTDSDFRPSVVMVNEGQADQRLDITIPAGAYENGATDDFWNPMESIQPVGGDEDDLFLFSAKLSVNEAGHLNSTGAEASSPRQTGWLFNVIIDPFPDSGLSGASLWDIEPRRFVSRVFNNTRRPAPQINLSLKLVPSKHQMFAGNPASEMVLSIHEFKLYKVSQTTSFS